MNNEQQGAAVVAAAAEAAPTTRRWRIGAALALAAMFAVLMVALGCQRRQEPVFEVLSAPAAAEGRQSLRHRRGRATGGLPDCAGVIAWWTWLHGRAA